ncbi:MAG TPA: YceI family protein [Vicinamibacteria bacterium]|jgi:polyisoprenoid-binding protein YceI
MSQIPPGEYKIDSRNGHLTLRTFREGMASIVGHDLVIDVTRWQGTVTVPAGGQPQLAVNIDMGSFEIREGLHGVKPLTDGDRDDIKGSIAETLKTQQHKQASFQSRAVKVQGDEATVEGDFTLAGSTQPLSITVHANGDRTVTGKAVVQQTLWGIKPYKAFLGALKVRDTVEVEATITLA